MILLPARRKLHRRGFTLLEMVMVMVMVMLAALGVSIGGKVDGDKVLYSRGFHDETMALLRFGQKSAIARRRAACVTFSDDDDSMSLRVASKAATPTCNQNLQGPEGGSSATSTITARPDVFYSATPTDFNFDGLGQPVDAASALMTIQTIRVVNASTDITAEPVTGYVHD
jgi:MSHA pilin protein MshC